MKRLTITLLIFAFQAAWGVVVNDVTKLNPVEVDRVETPRSVEEVRKLLIEHKGPVSIGGGRFSMGGQTSSEKTLHLDMRQMNQVVSFSKEEKWITVQPGITWRKIQEYIDPFGLSVKVMQSYASFSVGGSLSVNVHGRYIGLGPLASTVRSLKVVTADGRLIVASPKENSELFWGVIGGYGALGVIVEASLDLADNVKVERAVKFLPVNEYQDHFMKEIRNNPDAVFHNGDIYPPKYDKVVSITWSKTDKPVTIPHRLMPVKANGMLEHAMLFGVSEIPFGKSFRAKVLDPMTYRKSSVVWRNYEASYDVSSLEPKSRDKSTYVLQEYFVPVAKFMEFEPKMAAIFRKHGANILNVSIRHAHKDPGSIMAWAREECFAFVVYYKQGTSKSAQDKVGEWTRELINAVLESGGTYYLPYQLHATVDQFRKAYPRHQEFFSLKAKLDAENRFRNKMWDKYYQPKPPVEKRDEAQTFLTIPEWYVVFSADEYAAFTKENRPSGFPYFASIGQFWSLYNTVLREARAYATNWEYNIMIMVVGISFTSENLIKGVYENTVGRFFEWTSPIAPAEEVFLAVVADEYAKFIHHTPWYAFPFRERLNDFWQLEKRKGAGEMRRFERRMFGSAELLGKAGYAWVIRKATGATFSPDEQTLQAVVDGELKTLPRYEAFTEAVRQVVQNSSRFDEISGNSKIVCTFIAGRAWEDVPPIAREIAEWPILTVPDKKRTALVANVNHLHELVLGLETQGIYLDHVFDY